MPDHPHPVVPGGGGDRGHQTRAGAVIDDHDLEVDVALAQHGGQRLGKEALPVVRRHDDADRGHGATVASR